LTEPDDGFLVRDFLGTRSESAFVALYRRHSPYLFALALRLAGGRRDEAEDALQEAWLRATERLPAFRFESALRTWLAGFVVRCVREQRRRRHPEREEPRGGFELDEIAPAVAPPAPAIDLERALARLPTTLRDVVVLFELEGLSHDEIGRLLEIPAGTSKSRLWFARRALRAALVPPHDQHDTTPQRGEQR
jgi:RNA polymerase sigma-70 factor (ECF subfamily)